MSPDKVFSIRTPLQGELTDFVTTSGVRCVDTNELIRDLVCLLGSYREEGTLLFPQVFIFQSISTLHSIAPGTQRMVIGKETLGKASAARILKECANLAVDGWAIYIVKDSAPSQQILVEFGLFRALKHAYATSAEESMVDPSNTSPVFLIRNCGHLIVEIMNTKKETFTASFTSAHAAKSPFADHINIFVESVCSELKDERKKEFFPYLSRLLLELIQHCHGILLAVCNLPNPHENESLKDGIWLHSPIMLADLYNIAVTTKDAESLATLQSYESLLVGMINSDGIVIFGTNGTVLGYHIFLKPTDDEKIASYHKGGGRRRTFELMKKRLDITFQAVFFRSQDGETDCKKV